MRAFLKAFPEETSVYAEEGTYVHELCEYKLKKHLHRRMKRPQSEEFDSDEAEQCSDLYLETIESFEEQMKADHGMAATLVEERLDFSHIVPEGFGTGDALLLSSGELHICDYKNGKGVFVNADHNSQMMLYALGAVRAYDYLFDFQTVSMTIIQPRLENISTCTMPKEELLAWGEKIRPIDRMAFEGKGEQKCGDWCRFCKAKAVCEARKAEAMALVNEEFTDLDAGSDVLTDNDPETISDVTAPYNPDRDTPVFRQPGLVPMDELVKLMPTLNRISDWIAAVFSYISSEAIQHGVKIHGYKVVEGRSKRIFSDPQAVADTAVKAGYTDIYKRELLTLTEFEKMIVTYGDALKEDVFKEHVGKQSVKSIIRTAKERGGGARCYAETMVIAYNAKKTKGNHLSVRALYGRSDIGTLDGEDGDEAEA